MARIPTKQNQITMQHELSVKIENNNPKTEGIKTYQIASMQDIADCVTVDNLEGFITDFKAVLSSYLLIKETIQIGIKNDDISSDATVHFPSFEWIDDWK